MFAGSVSHSSHDPQASLEQRVEAELVRIAYRDALYGAPFTLLMTLLLGYAAQLGFPRTIVVPWVAFTLLATVLRLGLRMAYLKVPRAPAATARWKHAFTASSALSGLAWGAAAWLFYTSHESIYRVLVVLVLAGITTSAPRLLAPIPAANLAYVFCCIAPLIARLMLDAGTRSVALGAMCLVYVVYMAITARRQIRTLRHSVRLGLENAELAASLAAAKERAENLNRELTAEIARREMVETELRGASARAEAASRAKTEFLATISHEIRTPMNGIIGMLRIVRDTPLDTTQREQLGIASDSADKLLSLLNNLLDFSRLEAGRLELERTAFSPSTVAKTSAELLAPRAKTKGLLLAVDVDPALPEPMFGDPTRLRQVLLNLIGNAIKFTERGHVRVRVSFEPASPRPAAVTFTISDSGIGIAPEALGRLFTPFTQADGSMSRRFGGSGLGLAISEKLVRAMGSALQVQSEPGRGSTFRFSLPLEAPGARPAANSIEIDGVAIPRLRGRVLVVEDDRVNQRVVQHYLKKLGLESGLAEDGLAAIAAAAREPWDAVLMDCQLPALDGLEATRRIRAARAGRPLPIIALTANATKEDRAACFAAGMDDFIAKPVRVELLAAALQKWLQPAPLERAS